MIEKIDINEVERNLPSGTPAKVRGLDKNGKSIASTTEELLSVIEDTNQLKRIIAPVSLSIEWIKLMEVAPNSNCVFFINLSTYINQLPCIIAGAISYHNESAPLCSFKSIIGAPGTIYNPNLKYKFENGKVKVWITGSLLNSKSLGVTMLSGTCLFPIVKETPPVDAIQPVW